LLKALAKLLQISNGAPFSGGLDEYRKFRAVDPLHNDHVVTLSITNGNRYRTRQQLAINERGALAGYLALNHLVTWSAVWPTPDGNAKCEVLTLNPDLGDRRILATIANRISEIGQRSTRKSLIYEGHLRVL
jgi:hypothetical protein